MTPGKPAGTKASTALSRFMIAFWLAAVSINLIATAEAETTATPAGQTVFATPDSAVAALIAANRDNKMDDLLAVLGSASAKLIFSGDPVADKSGRARFLAAYDEGHKVEFNGQDKATLIVGPEEWPFPIPLVRDEGGGWRFDTNAGATEILDRRIGRNELSVIGVCRAYVIAQRDYAARHPSGSTEYAQHFTSAAGRRDGLYWPINPGEEESPLGPLIARARAAGYTPGAPHTAPRPYYGYLFRILTRQGKDAPGGTRDYVFNKRMTGGFALIAYPAEYRDSGIMTFIVNQDGIIYQKNLGPQTIDTAEQVTRYDPDNSWQVSQP
jgi:hypothetical protein